ncbi:Clp protease ClpB [Algoriphagus sp. AGSA1]|uniref:Clp protease ClpB n=1 Tax=Algoriphagus sp. AGSA1 TaxID=2907213 RepID=UPI001F3F9B21|nr:Clp protease ClpB [Algoriphagus sp. AGSA1]MCE7056919.1 Clp protease ClpB [Algoriphagus sp. AGSA1]
MTLGIILLLFKLVTPQLTEAGQAKLEKMVQERDALTRQWKESESKKSGIFGNRTKKDMIETNEWLERIIAKDNLIMDELRMIGDIEKTTATQTGEDYKAIAFKLEKDVQALKRAVAERDKQLEEKLSERRTFEWLSLILFLVSLGLGMILYKKIFKT